MKGNNKGYSLVELLITLVIFGIVMVGIGMIMRTTSVSYVNSSSEVSMQTEAQIIANQIEELLVDANGGGGYGEGTKGGYVEHIIYDAYNNYRHHIVHNTDTNELWYDRVDGITAGSSDLSEYSLMAEYVTYFDIDGFSTAEDDPDRDNKVTIVIEMDNQGYVYEVTKEVFFRNAIEDATIYQLSTGGGGGDEDEELPYDVIAQVDRYGILDLKKEFDIVSVTGVTDNFSSMYTFANVNTSGGTLEIAKAYTSCTATSSVTNYITTNATVNSTAGFSSSCNEATKIIVTGTKADGTSVKVLLKTDAVEFELDTVNPSADGAVYLSTATGDGGGGYMWVGVKGINIASMVYTNSCPYSYALVAYDGNGSKVYSYTDSNKPQKVTVNSVSHGYGSGVSLVLNDCGMQKGIAFKADPESNGFIIVQDNNALSANAETLTAMANGEYRISIMIHFPGQANNSSHTVVDLALVPHGSDMSNYLGANIYTELPSNWGITF